SRNTPTPPSLQARGRETALLPEPKERVLDPFRPDGRVRTVARVDDGAVGQRHEAGVKAHGQLLGAGSGEVDAPDPARHQRVAGEQVVADLEAEATGGVTGCCQQLQRKGPEWKAVAVGQVPIGRL